MTAYEKIGAARDKDRPTATKYIAVSYTHLYSPSLWGKPGGAAVPAGEKPGAVAKDS